MMKKFGFLFLIAGVIFLGWQGMSFASPQASECFKTSLYQGKLTILEYSGSCGTEVIIPKLNEYPMIIGSNAFKDKGLTKVTLPEGLIEIGQGAFGGNRLEYITFPTSLEKVYKYSFGGNKKTPLPWFKVGGVGGLWIESDSGLEGTSLNEDPSLPNDLKTTDQSILSGDNGEDYFGITKQGLRNEATGEQFFTFRSKKVWTIDPTSAITATLEFSAPFTGKETLDQYVLITSSSDSDFSSATVLGTGALSGENLIFENVNFSAETNYMTVAIRDLTPPDSIDVDIEKYSQVYFSGNVFPLIAKEANDTGVGVKEYGRTITSGTQLIGVFTGAKNFNIPVCQSISQTDCIPQGLNYKFALSVVDRAGNISKITCTPPNFSIMLMVNIIVDATAPEIRFIDGVNEIWINYGSGFDISTGTLNVSDNLQRSAIKIDLKTNPDPLPTAPFTGSFRVIYTATDWAGNSSQKERTIRVNEAPEIEGLSVTLGTENDKTKPTITFTPKDETRNLTTGKIEIYGGGTDTLLSGKDLNSLNNGTPISETFTLDEKTFYTVKVKIRDEGGLFAEKELSYPPTVNFEPKSFAPTSGDIQVKVKIWSPGTLSEVKFEAPFRVKIRENTINQGDNFKDNCSSIDEHNMNCDLVISTLTSQTGDIKILAKDQYSKGNNSLKLIIDQTKPQTPVFTSPSENLSQKNKNLTFQWNSLTDKGGADLDKIFWSLKKENVEVESGEFIDLTTRTLEKTDMADGIYTLTLWTQDKAGNISDETTSNSIQIDITAPTEIQNLTSSFDPDAAKLSFSWDKTTDAGVGLSGYSWTLEKDEKTFSGGVVSSDEEKLSIVFENIEKSGATYKFFVKAVDKLENETREEISSYITQLVKISFQPGAYASWKEDALVKSGQVFFKGQQRTRVIVPVENDFTYRIGYQFSGWNSSLPSLDSSLTENATYSLLTKKNPDAWTTIHFDAGSTGELPGAENIEVLKETKLGEQGIAGPMVLSTKIGRAFSGWQGFSEENSINMPTTYMAEYSKTGDRIRLSFDPQNGQSLEDQELPSGVEFTLPSVEKNGFTLSGRVYTGEEMLFSGSFTPVKSGTLYAQWEAVIYHITFDTDGGTIMLPITGTYGMSLTQPADPTKIGWIFSGWDHGFPSTMPAEDLVLRAIWKSIPTPAETDSTPKYSGSGGRRGNNGASNIDSGGQNDQKSEGYQSPYGEQQTAYERAYQNKITTLYPQTEARLYEPITRAELAKMMSVYAMKFLKKIPLSGKEACGSFSDRDQTSIELAGFMQTACELEIMGLQSDGKTPLPAFRPNDFVSRAEFATVLSRMKRGNLYDNNQQEGRWDNHLKNLNEKAIITVPDPMIMELRGWILLMLHRMEN